MVRAQWSLINRQMMFAQMANEFCSNEFWSIGKWCLLKWQMSFGQLANGVCSNGK